MKKFFFLFALIATFAYVANAQMKWITVMKGTKINFYTSLRSACDNAEAGSDIIIPGGVWTGGFSIAKELHLYGVGHYPAYTGATEKTVISASTEGLQFISGSNNSSLTGLEIYSTTTGRWGVELTDYFSPNTNLDNIKISRCNIKGLRLAGASNFKARECVFTMRVESYGLYYGHMPTQSIFENNIFDAYFSYTFYYCTFDHNIFIKGGPGAQYGTWTFPVFFSNITNNIFVGEFHTGQNIYACANENNFFNNLTMYEPISFAPECHENLSGNISGVSIDNIFVNYSTPGFDYGNDYHLKSTCPGKNAATDGTDLGIYGTAFPYKDGAVPVIPHYTNAQIDNSLQNGLLHINVTVEAQTK